MPTDLVQSFRIDEADLPSEAVIFGSTASMRDVQGQIERILKNDLPVLIRGESGTGKEVVARFLHARSDRCDCPFVKVNCGAIPVGLLEREPTGQGNGGAAGAGRGLMEIAAGGTLFLDEIADLKWEMQTKLLDLLEESQDRQAGARPGQRPRVRIVCATNRDLEQEVERRAFRQDLFYRIDVINLNLAPLRERKQDMPQLCGHFLEKLARKYDKAAPQLSPGAMQLLTQWNWPGNLHELENRLARLIVLGEDRALEADLHRQAELSRAGGKRQAGSAVWRETAHPAKPGIAKAALLRALQANRWNRRRAAEDLHMSYRSLLTRLREVGVHLGRRSHKEVPPKQWPE